jgi:PAS domain S-box-containing protein
MILQQNFNDFFEGSSEGIIITDEETNIVYFNSIILEMLPNIPKSPTKSDFNNLINLDCIFDQEISYNLFELDHLILATKKKCSIGKKKYLFFRLKTSDKDSVERRLSFFLNNIDEIVYTEKIVKNKRENVGFISKGIEKITGICAEEMILQNKLPYQFASANDKKRILEFIKKVNKTKKPDKCQFRIENKLKNFNTWIELSIYPQILNKNHHFANFGVIRDISKDIEADQLLRQSELKHRLLFSEANDAIMIFKDIEMVDCNEKTLSMFNASGFLEIAGKKLYELMPEKQPNGEDSVLNYHYHMRNALDGDSQFFYWRHSKLSGEQFDCEVSINSFTVESDSYIQVIVRDITQRKIAEEQKKSINKKLFRNIQLKFGSYIYC